jgi:hypothetical protein
MDSNVFMTSASSGSTVSPFDVGSVSAAPVPFSANPNAAVANKIAMSNRTPIRKFNLFFLFCQTRMPYDASRILPETLVFLIFHPSVAENRIAD